MSGVGRVETVMGVDPGTYSLGVCVLRNGKVSQIYQREIIKPMRTRPYFDDWRAVVRKFANETSPEAVGLEIIEPQPWRTQGRIPKGLAALTRMVNMMALDLADFGFTVYPQSPSIQSRYEDFAVDSMIRAAMGTDFKILPHLRSATKHALEAQACLEGAEQRRRAHGITDRLPRTDQG